MSANLTLHGAERIRLSKRQFDAGQDDEFTSYSLSVRNDQGWFEINLYVVPENYAEFDAVLRSVERVS